jgi:hypothetical protein
MDYMKTFTR